MSIRSLRLKNSIKNVYYSDFYAYEDDLNTLNMEYRIRKHLEMF